MRKWQCWQRKANKRGEKRGESEDGGSGKETRGEDEMAER